MSCFPVPLQVLSFRSVYLLLSWYLLRILSWLGLNDNGAVLPLVWAGIAPRKKNTRKMLNTEEGVLVQTGEYYFQPLI